MARSLRPAFLYRHLWEIDASEVQRIAGFDSRELPRFAALIAEARASTLSYLLETIAGLESKQAGRLFSARQTLKRWESPR
jgi:hypothetical protein